MSITIGFSILLTLCGLLSLFAEDLVWEIRRWQGKSRHKPALHTRSWQDSRVLTGLIETALGITLLLFHLAGCIP